MNVFEKYLDNVAENAKLTDVINQLCELYLIKNAAMYRRVCMKIYKNFDHWEIDIDDPTNIVMHFYSEGIDCTEDDPKLYHETKKIPWQYLLIKVDGYD